MPIDAEIVKQRELARQQVIMQGLAEQGPSTVAELSEALGIPYVTLRKAMNLMVKNGAIQFTGFFKGKAAIYSLKNDNSTIFRLRHAVTGYWATPMEILEARMRTSKEALTTSAVAAQSVPTIIFNILLLAQRLEAGQSNEADIKMVRQQIATALQDLTVAYEFLKQLNMADGIFTPEALIRMAQDSKFPDSAWWAAAAEFFGS